MRAHPAPALLAPLLFMVLGAPPEAAALIGWSEGASGYEQAVARMKRNDRPLLLYFYTDWCPYCRLLESKVLTQSETRSALDDFLCVRINAEGGADERRLARRFEVSTYPSVFILPALQGQSRRISSFDSPQAFIKAVNDAVAAQQPRPAEKPVKAMRPKSPPSRPFADSERVFKEEAVAPDTSVVLKTGETFEGRLIQDDGTWVSMQTRTGRLLFRKDTVSEMRPLEGE